MAREKSSDQRDDQIAGLVASAIENRLRDQKNHRVKIHTLIFREFRSDLTPQQEEKVLQKLVRLNIINAVEALAILNELYDINEVFEGDLGKRGIAAYEQIESTRKQNPKLRGKKLYREILETTGEFGVLDRLPELLALTFQNPETRDQARDYFKKLGFDTVIQPQKIRSKDRSPSAPHARVA